MIVRIKFTLRDVYTIHFNIRTEKLSPCYCYIDVCMLLVNKVVHTSTSGVLDRWDSWQGAKGSRRVVDGGGWVISGSGRVVRGGGGGVVSSISSLDDAYHHYIVALLSRF